MGVVSKYGNLYDVKKNIICHFFTFQKTSGEG